MDKILNGPKSKKSNKTIVKHGLKICYYLVLLLHKIVDCYKYDKYHIDQMIHS